MTANCAVFLTPDEDHYAVMLDDEFEKIVRIGPRGGVPAPIAQSKALVYRFKKKYDRKELGEIFKEGAVIAVEERRALKQRGAVVLPVKPGKRLRGKTPMALAGRRDGAGGALAGGGDNGASNSRVRVRSERPEAPKKPPPVASTWVLAELVENHMIGEDVGECVEEHPSFPGVGLCTLDEGQYRAVLVPDADLVKWVTDRVDELKRLHKQLTADDTPRGELEDARILGVLRDSQGLRFRDYRDAVRNFTEQAFADWRLEGPRTVLYCAKEISKHGMGPTVRFQRWKVDNKLSDDDAGVDVCELISEVCEAAVTIDQLDISNLQCFEQLERKRQFWEECYRQRLEEQKLVKHAGKDAASLNLEAFSGRARMAGGAVISPLLITHVAKKAAEDSEILKQQRKALEARGITPPKPAGGGGGGKK